MTLLQKIDTAFFETAYIACVERNNVCEQFKEQEVRQPYARKSPYQEFVSIGPIPARLT